MSTDEAVERLKKDIAKAEAANDPLRVGRKLLALQVARARYKKKLSQEELAERAGMKQSHISNIESGKGNPTLDTLLRIVKALDADLMIE